MKKIIVLLLCFAIVGCSNGQKIVEPDIKDDTNVDINTEINTQELIEEVSKTKEKNAIFFGDSIVRGVKPDKYSWATYIGENYDFASCTNAGIGDYRLSTYDDPNKWLVDEVKGYINNDYDYVILEGGVNDLFNDTPIGQIGDYDQNTYIGGLENYLKLVTDTWPNAKIGYIVTYYAPNYTERGLSWSIDEYKQYNDILISVLDKWNIKYLDLSNDFFINLIDVNSLTYLQDYLHPNYAGYDLLSPYIYEFMLTLESYS